MLAEIIPRAYDAEGKRVLRLSRRRHKNFAPTYPMGCYLSQPLSVKCSSLEEIRQFLVQCRYVSDQKQFHKEDYWMPPEDFEKRKQGDCDDFALWTWRQLLDLGYDARFVVGRSGQYGRGHAWVTMVNNGKTFLVEPLAAWVGMKMPRLRTARYYPWVSVRWDGAQLQYFEHEDRTFNPNLREFWPLLSEWCIFWILHRPKFYFLWIRYFLRKGIALLTRTQESQRRGESES